MTSWKNDPELAELRADFMKSLEGRLQELQPLMDALASDPEIPEVLRQVQDISHRVSGIAGSYGFKAVTRVANVLDDYLDLVLGNRLGERAPVLPTVKLLCEVMEAASRGEDSPKAANDPRLQVLLKYF